MSRVPMVFLAITFVLATASPAPSSGHSYAFGTHDDKDQGLGWAIVDGENTSMSDMRGLESLDDLKSRFGDEFLYIREGRDQYVIEDEKLVARARQAARGIQKYGKEIGELARAQARLALGVSRQDRRVDKLERAQAKLERRIERAAERNQSTEDLERELDKITAELESIEDHDDRGEQLSSGEVREMTRRREEASKQLQRGVREVQNEIREILRDAKRRGLAERLDRR